MQKRKPTTEDRSTASRKTHPTNTYLIVENKGSTSNILSVADASGICVDDDVPYSTCPANV